MEIIDTCPVCGGDLLSITICTYPSIPQKRCPSCGWSWEGKREQIVRVPFNYPPSEKEQEAERAFERLLRRLKPTKEDE